MKMMPIVPPMNLSMGFSLVARNCGSPGPEGRSKACWKPARSGLLPVWDHWARVAASTPSNAGASSSCWRVTLSTIRSGRLSAPTSTAMPVSAMVP